MFSIYKNYDLVNKEYKHILDYLKFNNCHHIAPAHIRYVYNDFKQMLDMLNYYE